MATSKKRKKIIIFSIIGVTVLGLTLAAVFRKKDPVVTVQTDKVSRRSLIELVVANGKIQPAKQVVISPEVAGEIVTLPVKEGDHVRQGDLLVQIRPDNYIASSNSAEANLKSAIGARNLAKAQLDQAEAEFQRNKQLFENKLVSDSVFLDFKTSFNVAKLRYESAAHQEDQARFGLDKASDDLSKTTISSPMDGTVTRLKSQLGERVLGTSFNMGTEIMTIADLTEMEARVDIGETDVVQISPGQNARLEIDAFKDRKFKGTVTDIANSAKGLGSSALSSASSGQQDATKFEVRIRINEKEVLLPGMSVTAEIETRSSSNALAVPFASVTSRIPKENKAESASPAKTNAAAAGINAPAKAVAATNASPASPVGPAKADKKPKETEVVFVVEGDHAKMVPVKIGITDGDYYEIREGLKEDQEIVSGNYRAIKELEDGRKILKGTPGGEPEKKPL
jgi:HlyD family secretion protein